MKKLVYVAVFVMLLFAFAGCKNKEVSNENKPSTSLDRHTVNEAYYDMFGEFINSFTTVEEENKNFIIKSSSDYAGFFYEIYDNYGNLLDIGFHDWRGNFDVSKNGNLVKLEYGFGGTNVHSRYRLYDVEHGKVSRYFDGPIAVNDMLVAYFTMSEDRAVLVVQDAFDTEKTYKEFNGKFDEYIWLKIIGLSFSDDGTKLVIKHRETNNEENIIEESFSLK